LSSFINPIWLTTFTPQLLKDATVKHALLFGKHLRISSVVSLGSSCLALILICPFMFASPHGQKVPDPKRVMEIQHALVEKGYLPETFQFNGRMDAQTTDALRSIAVSHHWQARHIPDARTLILLGLSKGDPDVMKHPNHLDYNKGAPEEVPEDEQ